MAFFAVPGPFDFTLTVARFGAFGADRTNVLRDGALLHAVDGLAVRIAPAPGGADVEPLDGATEAVARSLLGVPFELERFYAWAEADAVLTAAMRRFHGFRPTLAPDPFEMLVAAITSQQVSLFSALAVRNRFVERFGTDLGGVWQFPSRERIAASEPAEVAEVGFTRLKAANTVALARADLDLHALAALPDDEVKEQLVALRGIGEWTADWFLARHLGRPHAWPSGDLALRKAVADLYGGLDVRDARERFHPYENLTAHYLLLAHRTR
jgi:3-methyladenine DNA glycosylase/8-oxoguanine DNA glycosylase